MANEVVSLREIPHRMVLYERDLKIVADGVKGCETHMSALAAKWEQYVDGQERQREEERKQREEEAKEREKERVRTIRWLIGTAVGSAAVIVAAMGIFFG